MGVARSNKLVEAGAFLTRRRKVRQWTQAEASKEIERVTGVRIPPQELSRIEKGQTSAPNSETLCALGATYGMEPNEIMELYGYWKPPTHTRPGISERAYEVVRDLDRLRPGMQEQLLETFELLIQAGIQRERRQEERARSEDEYAF
jgi:transcriptional regulator with XRE-family HTH domain